MLRRRNRHFAPSGRSSGESNVVDVLNELGTDFASAMDNRSKIRVQPALDHQISGKNGRQRGQFGRLGHNCISGEQGRIASAMPRRKG